MMQSQCGEKKPNGFLKEKIFHSNRVYNKNTLHKIYSLLEIVNVSSNCSKLPLGFFSLTVAVALEELTGIKTEEI